MKRSLLRFAILIATVFSSVTAYSQSWVIDGRHTTDSRLGTLMPLPYRINNVPKEKAQSLSIFPNPASRETTVRAAKGSDMSGKLEVSSQAGVVLISKDWQGGKLDVSGLPEGLYMVVVKDGNRLYSQKLVVKRE